MRVIGSLFLALFCGAVGYFAAAIIYYMAMTAIEGGDFEGGNAIGAALVVGPIGAVAGGIFGLLLGLKLFRRVGSSKAETAVPKANDKTNNNRETEDPLTLSPDKPRKKPFLDGQALTAISLLGLILLGIWLFLFRDDTPPSFPQFGPRPTAHFEIRVPILSIVEVDDFKVRMELHSVNNIVHVYDPIKRRDNANEAIFSGRIKLLNKTWDRSIAVWLSRETVYFFDLGLDKHPIEREEFSEWRRVTRIEHRKKGTTELQPPDADFFIRSRASWGVKQP